MSAARAARLPRSSAAQTAARRKRDFIGNGAELPGFWQKTGPHATGILAPQSRSSASHILLTRIHCEHWLPPHPGPLPLRGGEGESPAVSPRSWRCKSSNGQVLATAEPTAPSDSLSPSEGERVGVRGHGKFKIANYQLQIC